MAGHYMGCKRMDKGRSQWEGVIEGDCLGEVMILTICGSSSSETSASRRSAQSHIDCANPAQTTSARRRTSIPETTPCIRPSTLSRTILGTSTVEARQRNRFCLLIAKTMVNSTRLQRSARLHPTDNCSRRRQAAAQAQRRALELGVPSRVSELPKEGDRRSQTWGPKVRLTWGFLGRLGIIAAT
jgi:hypothetical protein